MRTPTDRKILKKIHSKYYNIFASYAEGGNERSSKIYVPIDCAEIAKELKVDPDIVFDRLYYHLEKKYGYTQNDGMSVHLFTMQVGKDKHAVNFPLLAAVLADLQESHRRFNIPLAISFLALSVSIISLIIKTN